jgi:ArsR family transcriptional regulator, virulence genes transcriptional regulator
MSPKLVNAKQERTARRHALAAVPVLRDRAKDAARQIPRSANPAGPLSSRAKAVPARAKGRSDLEALAAQAAAAARMLKLLGNEHRLLILCFLVAHKEMRVGELVSAVGLSQSALSQHLAILRADGLVTFRRDAQTLYYRISDLRAARVLKLLKDIYCGDMT